MRSCGVVRLRSFEVREVRVKEKRFQILALDGGGIKGLFSAAVLACVEENLNTSVVDHFDLIVGTSTGGIIALALGIGLKPRDIVEYYQKWGAKIFRKKMFTNVRQLLRTKYTNEVLKKSLIDCFGDAKLGDSQKRLVIPSFNIEENQVHLFKTPHHPRLNRDWKLPIWQVAMAASAAPSFFPVYKGINNLRLVDGGVWANNPSMVGIVEAKSLLEVDLESIHLLNVGTTREVMHRPDKIDSGGFWQWKSDAVNLIMEGQSAGTYAECELLLGRERVYRLNPVVPKDLYVIDKLNLDKLNAKAEHEGRIFSRIFQERFMDHRAPAYTPLQPSTKEI